MVIANAGVARNGQPPWEMDASEFRETVEVNLIGCFHVTRHLLPLMMRQAHSEPGAPLKRLINMSSGVGHSTNPVVAAYASSKWGVEALSKCTSQALRREGLQDKVLCVPFAPGAIRTEMNQAESATPTDEWAPVAARFLLQISPAQSGASLSLDGFYSEAYKGTWQIPDGHPIPDEVVWPA